MSNHDNHYRSIENDGLIEPIVRMESTICLGLPVEYHAIARRNLNLAMADKHIGRVGQKSGEVEDKELNKAANYLHRARTGSWRPEGVKPATAPSYKDIKDIVDEQHERVRLTVTTHGKTAEATEEEVGKVAAELRATAKDCSTCKHGRSNAPSVGVMPCKVCFGYGKWEARVPEPEPAKDKCELCKHKGRLYPCEFCNPSIGHYFSARAK